MVGGGVGLFVVYLFGGGWECSACFCFCLGGLGGFGGGWLVGFFWFFFERPFSSWH